MISAGGRRLLEAVVFDAGGTLVRLDFEWMSECVTALGHAVTAAALRRGEIEGRRRYDASRGVPPEDGAPSQPLGSRGDIRAYFAGMLEAGGVPAALVEPAYRACEDRHRETGLWARPMEGAREALDALAAIPLRCAAVSNSDGRAEQHLVDCAVRDGLEFVIDSDIVGIEKPDPRIFQLALERMGVAPERAVYVGDILSVDGDGARAAGMHFVLIDPFGDYAPTGVESIASIDRLPDHLRERFDIVATAPAAATRTPNRAVP